MEKTWKYTALKKSVSFIFFLLFCTHASCVGAKDRELGFYYPKPKYIESYRARMRILPIASRITRLDFIQRIAFMAHNKPYLANSSIFSSGASSENMIVISSVNGRLDTVYRVRAALVNLAALARKMPVFRRFKGEANLTFYDLGKMLGFKKITVSDGRKYTYQIHLK
jgi:hypothetical protein